MPCSPGLPLAGCGRTGNTPRRSRTGSYDLFGRAFDQIDHPVECLDRQPNAVRHHVVQVEAGGPSFGASAAAE